MTKHPVFDMADCWGCGEPTVRGGLFTAGCPGCSPDVECCEKASDFNPQEFLYPELREFRMIDEAIIDEALAREGKPCLSR